LSEGLMFLGKMLDLVVSSDVQQD